MSPEDEKLLFTVEEIANLLRKKARTIREMCYNHQIPHYKVGRSTRFRLVDILKWLEQDCRVDPIQNSTLREIKTKRSRSGPPAIAASNRAVTSASG
jgi:excisionase family DNA binding protein